MLPSSGTGRRARRREDERLERRRRRGVALAGGVWVLSLVGLAMVIGPRLVEGSGDDPPAATVTSPTPERVTEVAPTAAVVQVDGDELVGVSVAVLAPAGQPGGSLVLVPVGTWVDVPGLGLEPLRRAHELGGSDRVALSLENLLGVGLDQVVVLDARSWARRVEPVAPLVIDNPAAIERIGDDGRVLTVWPEGEVVLDADEVGAFLAASSYDEPDLDRLVRHGVVWRAWLEGLAGIEVAAGDERADLDAFLDRLAAGPLDVRLVPVETLTGTGRDTEYSLDRDGVDALVDEVLPGAASASAERVRVQLLNGAGAPGLAARATEVLVPAGARVDVRDNAQDFDHEVTQFVYYRDDQRAGALRLRNALGVGDVVKGLEPLDVIDVTVVLGRDFASVSADPTGVAPANDLVGP